MDPALQLALAIYHNKGAYALLLGSGVSRAAAIPTGWEVVLDLIRQVAAVSGEADPADPARWYEEKFGEMADYSAVVERLARTPAERQALLRPYFEPTDEERRQGKKLPTAAHHAIAWLVAHRYVRVILQTNFDTLTETAVREAGVRPAVLASPDAIAGALPLAHADATVAKLHGDYLDSRLLNTRGELERYDERTDKWLDDVLDDYGLVICGWSAEWDRALVAAVERTPTRRYTTFWGSRSTLGEQAQRLAELRDAAVVPIADADQFFSDLVDRLIALERVNADHPISAAIAAERVKELLSDADEIRLHDYVQREIEAVRAPLQDLGDGEPSAEAVTHFVEQVEAQSNSALAVVSVLGFWGESDSDARLAVRALARLSSAGSDAAIWPRLRLYGAFLAMYSAGISAVAAGNDKMLARLLQHRVGVGQNQRPLIEALNYRKVAEDQVAWLLPGMQRHHTPLSDRVFTALREPLRALIPDDSEYEGAFDRFEYLMCLQCVDNRLQAGRDARAPVGRFGWLDPDREGPHPSRDIEAELHANGPDWGLLREGLTGGDIARAYKALAELESLVDRLGWRF